MKNKEHLYGAGILLFLIFSFIAGIVFISAWVSAEEEQNTVQGITIPEELSSGDVLPAVEWNKVRQALIDLNNKTGEINIGKDGKMGVGLNGEKPEEDLHIKGTTYADANILLEDGEAESNKWSIGGGEKFYVAKVIGDLAKDEDRKDTLKDGLTIDGETLNVGVRNHDPKVPLHVVKGDTPITGREYSPSKTVIIENSVNERTREFPKEEDAENNLLSLVTHDKRGQSGVQFATGENDGWHGWLGFFNEIEHKKLQFFDKDSEERHIMLSANGPNEFQEAVKNSFFVNSEGNAGMGTDKPFHKFHVFEVPSEVAPEISDPRFNIQTSFVSETQQGDANIGIAVNNNSATSRIQFSDEDLNDSGGGIKNKWDGVIEYFHKDDDLSFGAEGKEHLAVLKKNGYFGVGALQDVKNKLHIKCSEEGNCGEVIGMFENDIENASGAIMVKASKNQSLYFSTSSEKGGYISNFSKDGKMIIEKESGQSSSDQDLFTIDKITGNEILLDNSSITLTDLGYIGINNKNPKHTLHILGGFSDTGQHPSDSRTGKNAILAIENKESNANIAIISPKASGIQFADGDGGGPFPWDGVIHYNHENSTMSFGTNSVNHRIDIDEKGWVGINKEDPEHGIHFVPKDEIMKLEGKFGINTTPSYGVHFVPSDGIMKVEGKIGVNKEPSFSVDATSINGDVLCVGGDCISNWDDLIDKLDLSTGPHTPPAASTDIDAAADANDTSGVSFAYSDRRLKTKITPLESVLEKIQQMNGVSYNWRAFTNKGSQREIGVIAQDVEKVFPELVTETKDGFKAVFYSKMVAVLLEGIKEQQTEIDALERRLDSLEKRLQAAGL